MKCSICNNIIITPLKCKDCSGIFCSFSCFKMHYLNYHNNNNYIYSENNTIINSPFIVKGTLNNEIIYDSTYSLEYFIPVKDQNQKVKIIGAGAFGQVYLGLNTITKKYYAIKHIDKQNIFNYLHSLSNIQKEIEIQSRINHPNIVKLLYVKETDISYDLVMEYASGGNLFYFIRKYKRLDENLSFNLFIQVVNAIYFLHKNDLIHRDIKPENILLFENNIVKLCDFGWCVKYEGQQRETFCGTTEYMSPELVNHTGYGKEIDLWSLGVLLYEMIHGHSPFRPNKPNFDAKDVMENIINNNIIFRDDVSIECRKLIYGLLDHNINKRYKIEDIFNSEFVKKYEKIKLELENNQEIFNQNNIYNSNQINNILISPQIEMNNNINIHMSMDMTNYIYNIQIPQEENINNNNINKEEKVRNRSFPKPNKVIFYNYENSSNNNKNLYNNNIINNDHYLSYNIVHNLKNSKSSENNLTKENSFFNNSSIPKQNKLIANEILNNISPLNIQNESDREKEFNDIYSSFYNYEIIPNKCQRDNKDFINFNNPIFYLFEQDNNNYNNLNQLNNNILNSNYNMIDINNKQNNKINEINNIQENKNTFNNLSYNYNISNNYNTNIFNNYSNQNNNISKTKEHSYINHFPPVKASLKKRFPLMTNNNVPINSSNHLIGQDKDFSHYHISNASSKIFSLENNKINNENINNNLINKSNIIYKANSKTINKENNDIKIGINNSNDLDNLNNKNYFSSQKKLEKEKEPIENVIGKNEIKTNKDGNMPKKQINQSVNINFNRNIYPHKSEEINIEQNEKSNIPLCKYISFDQPRELNLNTNESINYLISPRTFCEIDKTPKIKFKKQTNFTNNRNNHSSDKKNEKKQKINKYAYKQKTNDLNTHKKGNETKKNGENIKMKTTNKKSQIDDDVMDISCSLLNIFYTKRETKINTKDNKINYINANKRTKNEEKFIDKKVPNSEKEFKNNKKENKNNKYDQNETGINKTNNKLIKFLKINKTVEEKSKQIKNRIDSANYNKNEINNLQKQILSSKNKDYKRFQTAKPSLKIINAKDNQISNSMNINNDVNIGKDVSEVNKRKQLYDKNNNLCFKQSESNIINNTYGDFNDTIDERTRPYDKNYIFNKMKPKKLLEAFKKELAELTKK